MLNKDVIYKFWKGNWKGSMAFRNHNRKQIKLFCTVANKFLRHDKKIKFIIIQQMIFFKNGNYCNEMPNAQVANIR